MTSLLVVLQSSQFVQFAYLQVLDILSTIAFLVQGAGEANPLVRWSMQITPNPIVGLVAVKLVGILLGMICVRSGREGLLSRINLFYAGLIAWNLVCLILAARL
jgi:hypothetical protein